MFQQAVTTVAVGRIYYLNLTRNLIRSFLLWNADTEIHFVLLTDNPGFFAEFKESERVHCIELQLEESEKSFTSKFLLFDNLLAQENLFIDCDCLVYGNLSRVFEMFKGHDFSAIGSHISKGEFFCDVPAILEKFNLKEIPWFVGSVYFYRNSQITKQVVEKAKELKSRYDELGFVRLRGKENEEPLLAVAMAIHDQKPILDDGTVKADLMYFKSCNCNVLTGKVILEKAHLTHGVVGTAGPLIVHFNSSFSEASEYLAEEYRLNNLGKSRALVEIYILLEYTLRSAIIRRTKNILRPLYHRLLGPTKVRKNKRIAEK